MGLLTPCFVPRGGVLYTMIVPGRGFLPPSSRVPGGGGWFWMKLIPTLLGEVSMSGRVNLNFGQVRYDLQVILRFSAKLIFSTK